MEKKMNTPEPCCRCKHLYANVLYEEDESYMAECKLGYDLHPNCKDFKDFEACGDKTP
jgi:hypothetical protein